MTEFKVLGEMLNYDISDVIDFIESNQDKIITNGWVSVEKDLPSYGEPVLIKINGVVQHVTYMLDGADESSDWFEPFHFDHDDNQRVWYHQVGGWMYLPA